MSLRRFTRPARHALAYAALRLLVAILRRLPLDAALATGGALGRLIGALARRERRRMAARINRALGAPPAPGDCFADLGRRFVEFACAERLLDRCVLGATGVAVFDAARARGRGVLLATAHLGNWELMAAALAARGYAVHAVAARPRSGPLHRWLARRRAALGVTVHPPGGGARAIVDRLRRGEAAAIFIDQATRERGRPIGFFGRPAPTPTTFARLLALTGATPLWLWSVRGADGRHHIRVEALPGDDPLAAATARLEAAVRAQPAQWVWLHDRWRDAAG
ncbi:MAG: lysophospholipid acyltransferase family protein [bacterium]